MSKFYTNVTLSGNKILVREIKNGQRIQRKDGFSPTLFVRSADETSPYKSLFGERVGPVTFDTMSEAKKFIQLYTGVADFPIMGNTSYVHQYIAENYPGEIEYDFTQLKILTIDIETSAEFGFPNATDPVEEVLLITVQDNNTKKITTFGARPFDVNNIQFIKHTDNYEYVKCKDEADLLNTFIEFWANSYPDIVTGWNTQLFDIPYLVARIDRVIGMDVGVLLSPWKDVKFRTVFANGREMPAYDISGISSLDYLDLYRKFTYTNQENYRLDHIAIVELGKHKLENSYDTYKDFYTKDWQRFVEYNVIDVELVDELEDKMRLIELIVTMAYDAKCKYNDVFSAVRTWDCILYNHLRDKNIVVPQKNESVESRSIVGAFVKEPVPGKYNWVVSFDAASLYPSIIMQHNLSPETLVSDENMNVNVEGLLNSQYDLSSLLDENVVMSANGYKFTRDKIGLFPEIVAKIFSERQFFKKKMIQVEKEYEKTHDHALVREISALNNKQMARKIQLNSLYGAWGNEFFRYYDPRIAEAVTMTGQYIIRRVANVMNEYLNKVCATSNVDYAFYGDTDSVYIALDHLVKKFYSNLSTEEIVNVLDKICKDKLEVEINNACSQISDVMNATEKKIFFKREVIADCGLWVAKKRYALNVHDSEGVRYEKPKLKVMGLEIVRSSTPASVREHLREAVRICLTGGEEAIQQYILEFEKKFRSLTPEEIAFPRGVNNLEKYQSQTSIYTKGTPLHVRGALLYNKEIKERKLEKRYEKIRNGDKIKFLYLTEPNTLGENCIAFQGKLPKELDLHRYVDYITMFEKTFLDPMDTVLASIKWASKPVATLEGLFS